MVNKKVIAVIDIGAGIGAKTGLFDLSANPILTGFLPVNSYGGSAGAMVARLFSHIKNLLDTASLSYDCLIALGVDMPGVISDGEVYICSNLPFLAGKNIRTLFEKIFRLPVTIINDGESGGLMEWRVRKRDLLFWVIGGGWGGAWIDPCGRATGKGDYCEVMDMGCFLVNEPGYATGLSDEMLNRIFEEYDLSLLRFCYYFIQQSRAIPWQLMDPRTGHSYIRAESIISNRGLYCLYQTVVERAEKSSRHNSSDPVTANPDRAGMEIYKLCRAGSFVAIRTMNIFGRIFGDVALMVKARAKACGASADIPIYLSGGLANSFDMFGEEMQNPFKRSGDHSRIEPSYFLDKGINTNIMGTFYITHDSICCS